MKAKSIREILGQLHIDANRNPGKESVDKALEAIQQLIEECAPLYPTITRDMVSRGEVRRMIDQYTTNLMEKLQ